MKRILLLLLLIKFQVGGDCKEASEPSKCSFDKLVVAFIPDPWSSKGEGIRVWWKWPLDLLGSCGHPLDPIGLPLDPTGLPLNTLGPCWPTPWPPGTLLFFMGRLSLLFAVAMLLLCCYYTLAMLLLCRCYAVAMWLLAATPKWGKNPHMICHSW